MDQNNHTSSKAGARWLAFMGLALAGCGALFTALLGIAWQKAEQTHRWEPTPARVLSSVVKAVQATPNSPTKFEVMIRYEYTWQGKTLVSERIRRLNSPKADLELAEALREQYTKGQTTTCYVNPDDPAFAILKQDSRAPLYAIWFPLLFVVGGLRMAWAALRRKA